MSRTLFVKSFLRLIILVFSLAAMAYSQEPIKIEGKVIDEGERPIKSAIVILKAQKSEFIIELKSAEDGSFKTEIGSVNLGNFMLSASAEGYWPFVKNEPIEITDKGLALDVKLIKKEAQTINVDVNANVYSEKRIDPQQVEMTQPLSGELIDKVPAPGAHKQLVNMIAILPGVIKDFRGQLHFRGSPADQINWKFNGFDIGDPNTGRLEANIGAQTAELNVFSSRYSVEYGPGSGGTIAIDTKVGKMDSFHQNITNFLPGVQFFKGLTFDSWVPRVDFSGPIIKNKVSFFVGLNEDYRQHIFQELPKGQDRTKSWSTSGIAKIVANLTPLNTLTFGSLVNYADAPYSNLSPLDPVETTVTQKAQRSFFYIKDQIVRPSRALFEFGYAMYRSRTREIPQGDGIYQFFPDRRQGNFSYNARFHGDRDEWLFNYAVPQQGFLRSHQLKFGINASNSRYDQDIRRTGIDYFRVDGTQVSSVRYSGQSAFGKSNFETSGFAQDRWLPKYYWLNKVFTHFVIEAGMRWDRNGFLGKSITTPRIGSAFMPALFKGKTKFSLGTGWIPEKGNLNLYTRNLDQMMINTRYDTGGVTPTASWISRFVIPPNSLTIPTILNTSFGVEQTLPRETYLQVNYLRKRERNGYAYFPSHEDTPVGIFQTEGPLTVSYILMNKRIESYDSVEFALTKNFKPSFTQNTFWCFISYEISKSRSNAAANIDTDEPIIYENRVGPMPWDIPHRLISWGMFPLDKNKRNEIRYFTEMRDGFPYSVYNGELNQVGELNSHRMPRYFTLNIQYGRKLTRFNREWEVRLGVDNLTNNSNYTLPIQNSSSPLFGTFYGRQPRRFVFGVRFLGNKKKTK